MRTSVELVIALAIFLPWLAAICTVQADLLSTARRKTPSLPQAWKKWDVLDLAPRFTFFSWLPNIHYTLFFRDRYSGKAGEFTPWRQIVLPGRTWWRGLWNPERRVRLALEDACRSLVSDLTRSIEHEEPAGYRHFPYTFLERFVADQPAFPGAVQRQFLLVQRQTHSPGQPAEPLFVSPLFDLASPLLHAEAPVAQAGGIYAA